MNNLNLKTLAEQYGTPLYVYDLDTVRENCTTLLNILQTTKGELLYAMMGNSHSEILQIIKEYWFGVQICSLDEQELAEKEGFSSNKISCTTLQED